MKKVLALAIAGIAAAAGWIAFRSFVSTPQAGPVPAAQEVPQEAAGHPPPPAPQTGSPAAPAAESPSITDLPLAPEGSPALRIVDPSSGEGLAGAWAILHRSEDEDPPAPIRGDARIRAGEDGILRIAEEILASGAWEDATIGASDRPAIRPGIGQFRRLFRLPPPGRPIDRSRAVPELRLLLGTPVSGRVLDVEGRPIESVQVKASGQISLSLAGLHLNLRSEWFTWSSETSTDAGGRFAVRILGDDDPTAGFLKAGFLWEREVLSLDRENAVTLLRKVRVDGTIADAEGKPIEEHIRAESGDSRALASSAADGSFSLALGEGLPYTIRASAEGCREARIEGYVARPGERLRITLHPMSRATARLLAGEERAPVIGVLVKIRFPIAGETWEATSDTAGRISFPFPAGEPGRELLFIAPEAGFARIVLPAPEDRDQDFGDVPLAPGHALQITVVDETGAPIPDLPLDLRLWECEEVLFSHASSYGLSVDRTGKSDAGGRLTFGHLIAGVHDVHLGDAERRMREDGANWVSIHVPQETERILEVVRDGRITGTVVDPEGRAIPDAHVKLPPWESCTTDWRGFFELAVPGSPAKKAPEGAAGDEPPCLLVWHDMFIDGEMAISHIPRPGEVLDAGEIMLRSCEEHAARLFIRIPDLRPEENETAVEVWTNESRMGYFGEPARLPDGILFVMIEPGRRILRVSRRGYLLWRSEPIDLVAGETCEVTPVFEPGIDLEGVVLDALTGTPIRGAWVRASGFDGPVAEWTDGRGRFRLAGFVPGLTEIAVYADGYDEFQTSIDTRAGIRDPIRLFPNRRDEEAGSARVVPAFLLLLLERPDGLRLPSGSSVYVEDSTEMMIRSSSSSRVDSSGCHKVKLQARTKALPPDIRFRVRAYKHGYSDWFSLPAGGQDTIGPIRVRLISAAPTVVIVTDSAGRPVEDARVRLEGSDGTTDRDGKVEMEPHPPGECWLTVDKDGLSQGKVVEHRGGDEPIRVTFLRGATLEGRIRFAGEPFPVYITLSDRSPSGTVVSPPESSFAIRPIEPGTWDLEVTADTDAVLFRERVRFDEAQSVPIDIDLTCVGAIEGQLVGAGKSAITGGIEVELRGDGIQAQVEVDGDGRFAFPHVAAGKYLIRHSGLAVVSRATKITVRAGETTRADLACRLSTLRGTVKGPDGSAPARATVTFEWDDEESDPFHVSPSGSFEILGIAEGPYRIRVEVLGFVPFRAPIEMEGDRKLDVTLTEGSGVEGETPASEGQP